jgi:geranylgeranyl reductase family protein
MTYEVLVVGAGPAGATAAKFLAEQGITTLLIDKQKYPREKPCGGILTLRTLKRFPYITDDMIDAYSYGGQITASSLRSHLQLHNENPIAAYVQRKKFDQDLVHHAVQSGADFTDNTTAIALHKTNDTIQLTLKNGKTLKSRLIIGADGTFSTIAKSSGLGSPYPHIGRCLFQEYPLKPTLLDQYFTKKRYFQFYLKFAGIQGTGWVFPKKNSVNIGIGEIQPLPTHHQTHHTPLKDVYATYLSVLKEKHLIPPTTPLGPLQGGILPLHPLKKTYNDHILLCGDAAGLMNPLTGDGIHYAMSSGMFAAQICTQALKTKDTSADYLSRYQQLWNDDFGEEITLCTRILNHLLQHDDEKYIKLLSKDTQLIDMLLYMTKNQVQIHTYKWKIIRRFIPLYLKHLLRI